MSHERRIFITGGASGLGRALAERYAREGYRVCIGDVNATRGEDTVLALRALGAEAHFVPCDVTKVEDLESAASWMVESWGGVDIVVNNAGVASGGGIAEVPLEDWQWIVDINLLGVVRGCKVFTPIFRRQGQGTFVNVSSLAGLVHAPMMSAYNATKAAVVALSETLRIELAKDNIAVSVVCPAFFRTNLTESLRATTADVERITHRLVNRAKRGPEEIAELTYRGVTRGDSHIVTHPEGKVAWMLKRLLPFSLFGVVMTHNTKRMMGRKTAPPGDAPARERLA